MKNEICGQAAVKRAMEVAAVAGLRVMLIGPCGSGKKFLTAAFPEVQTIWMHSCPCGYYRGVQADCVCTPERLKRWLGIARLRARRYDIILEVCPLPYREMNGRADDTFAARFAARVQQARAFKATTRVLDDAGQRVEEMAVRRLGISKSELLRVHKVANAIADLDASSTLQAKHIAEAVQYRIPHWMRDSM